MVLVSIILLLLFYTIKYVGYFLLFSSISPFLCYFFLLLLYISSKAIHELPRVSPGILYSSMGEPYFCQYFPQYFSDDDDGNATTEGAAVVGTYDIHVLNKTNSI